MVTLVDGDIFESKADAVINAVNCQGTEGKGLALAFAQRYPGNSQTYKFACLTQALEPGGMVVHELQEGPWRYILNVATKGDWRNPSTLPDIHRGLVRIRDFCNKHQLKSLATCALGCGLGGLDFESVLPLMYKELDDIKTKVSVYRPIPPNLKSGGR